MIKEHLTFDEREALFNLISLVRDVDLLVENDIDDDREDLITTGTTINLEHFERKDWDTCLKLLES